MNLYLVWSSECGLSIAVSNSRIGQYYTVATFGQRQSENCVLLSPRYLTNEAWYKHEWNVHLLFRERRFEQHKLGLNSIHNDNSTLQTDDRRGPRFRVFQTIHPHLPNNSLLIIQPSTQNLMGYTTQLIYLMLYSTNIVVSQNNMVITTFRHP